MILLTLQNVGMAEDTASFVLILKAPDLDQVLVMEVGLLEGRAIALVNQGIQTPRPLTHDLIGNLITTLGAVLAEVKIHDFRDQTFYASLVLNQENGNQVEVDARPSDAIAMALRASVPIYTTAAIMQEVGMDESLLEEEGFDEADELADDPDEKGHMLH
jgi:bifunctional DNase/RNase